jgi:hypothetical protein
MGNVFNYIVIKYAHNSPFLFYSESIEICGGIIAKASFAIILEINPFEALLGFAIILDIINNKLF